MNVKKILSFAVVLAMVLTVVPAFGLVASAAPVAVGEYLVDTWTTERYVSTSTENLVSNPDFANGTDGWTRASDGEALSATKATDDKDVSVWELVDKDEYSASESNKSIHLRTKVKDGKTETDSGGAAADQTLRTFFEAEKGKTYLVSFNIHNAGNAATTNNGSSGMIAIVGVEKTGTGFGSYKDTATGLAVYGPTEYGGNCSWLVKDINPVEGTTMQSTRNDGSWKVGDNRVAVGITIPESAQSPYIMLSLGAWGNTNLYYSDFSIQEAKKVERDASVKITVVDETTGDTLETIEESKLYSGDEYKINLPDYKIYKDIFYKLELEKDTVTLAKDLNEITVNAVQYQIRNSDAENLIPNPSFEDDFAYWTGVLSSGASRTDLVANSNFSIETAAASEGSKSLRVQASDGESYPWLETEWKIDPNSAYEVSFDLKTTNKTNQYCWFYAAGDGTATTVYADAPDGSGGQMNGLDKSKFVTKKFDITSNDKQTRLGFAVHYASDSKGYYDNFVLRKFDSIPAKVTVKYVDENKEPIAGVDDYIDNKVVVGDKFSYSLPVTVTGTDGTYVRKDAEISVDFVKTNTEIKAVYKKDSVESADPIEVDARVGVAPKLPKTVTAKLESGSTIEADVVWPEVKAENYKTVGETSEVVGTIRDTQVKVTANVTVKDTEDYLVVHYTFDDTTGISKVNNDKYSAAVGSNLKTVDGIVGNAIDFSGIDAKTGGYAEADAIKINGNLLTDEMFAGKEFTVSTYIKKKSNANQSRIFDFGNSLDGTDLFLSAKSWNEDSQFVLQGKGSATGMIIPTDGWHKVYATLEPVGDGTWTAKMYLDGEEVGTVGKITADFTAVGSASVPNYYIGASNWGDSKFDGMFDEFKIYSVALTDAEIKKASPNYKVTVDYVLEKGGVAVYTETANVIGGADFELPTFRYNKGRDFYIAPAKTYENVSADINEEIVLDKEEVSIADHIFTFNFKDSVKAVVESDPAVGYESNYWDPQHAVMTFPVDVPAGKHLVSAKLSVHNNKSEGNSGVSSNYRVYSINADAVDKDNNTMNTYEGEYMKAIGGVQVSDGIDVGSDVTTVFDLDLTKYTATDTIALMMATRNKTLTAGLDGDNFPYLYDIVMVDIPEIPEIEAKLGWKEDSKKFTIDYVPTAAITPVEGATYAVKVTASVDGITGGEYNPAKDAGVGIVPNDTNDVYSAISTVTVSGVVFEAAKAVEAGIYGLVMDAIFGSTLTGEIEATQLEAVNEVLKNGNILLTTDEEGTLKLTEAADKVMTLEGDTITLTEKAVQLGLRFTTIGVGTDAATAPVATVSDDGKSITLPDGVTTAEAMVLSLDSVYLEFVPTEMADVDADGADAVQDFIPEL